MRTEGFVLCSFVVAFAPLACGDKSPPGTPDGGGDVGVSESASDAASGRIVLFDSERALDGSDTASATFVRNIWMTNEDGTGAQPLTHLTTASATNPVWSPDGTRIAFVSEGALDGSDVLNGTLNIWVMKADGSGATPLTRHTAAHADSVNPVWSPDGTKIAFQSQGALDGSDAAFGVGDVWTVNVDGTGAKPLVPFVNAQSLPFAFSHDGTRIVYRSSGVLSGADQESGSNNVWIMKADGTAQTHLTAYTAKVFVSEGSFSADDLTVLYRSDAFLDGSDAVYPPASDAINIWTVSVTSMTKTPLTNLTHADAHDPAYSPDGKKIVFGSSGALDGSDAYAAENLWLMNADGSARAPLTKLTKSGADYPAAQWSKDGSQLLYTSMRALDGSDSVSTSGVMNGWLVQADGSAGHAVTKLTVEDCVDFTLDW